MSKPKNPLKVYFVGKRKGEKHDGEQRERDTQKHKASRLGRQPGGYSTADQDCNFAGTKRRRHSQQSPYSGNEYRRRRV